MTITKTSNKLGDLQHAVDRFSDHLGERYADGRLTGWESIDADKEVAKINAAIKRLRATLIDPPKGV